MPRAKAISDEIKPKRATASRATRRVSSGTVSTAPARRKAPTVIPASSRRYSAKSLLITLSVFVVIMAGSAFVGMADSGEINVSGVIQERGATLREAGRVEEANQLTIPKDGGQRQPNGGLRPQMGGGDAAPTPAPATLGAEDSNPAADSVATSTEPTEEVTPAEAAEPIAEDIPVADATASST